MLLAERIDVFAASNSLDVLNELKKDEFKDKGIMQAGIFKEIYIYPYLNIKHKDLVNEFTFALNEMKRQNTFQGF